MESLSDFSNRIHLQDADWGRDTEHPRNSNRGTLVLDRIIGSVQVKDKWTLNKSQTVYNNPNKSPWTTTL